MRETPLADVGDVLTMLGSFRYNGTTEAIFQDGVEHVLSRLPGAHVQRECRLSKSDRIDFLVNGSIGIECKTDGSSTEVARQLARYAQHECIEALILVTTRRRHASQMPSELNGKRIFVFATGAWTS